MKKYIKLTALVLCIAALCVSLCSCQYLDDARAKTAVYTDDSKDSFTFRGNLYKKMEISDKYSFIIIDVQGDRYVTAPDVPVLLSKSYGDMMNYDAKEEKSPTVIRVYRNLDETLTDLSDSDVYIDPIIRSAADSVMDDYIDNYIVQGQWYTDYAHYIREDKYDDIKASVDSAVMDHYFTLVYTYDNDAEPWSGGKYLPALLDDDATEVIKRTMSGKETASWDDLSSKQDWYAIQLAACDKDMLLSDNSSYNSNVTMITNSTDYYLFYMNDSTKLYKVSDDDFSAIRKVYSMCKDSLEYADIDFYKDN